MPWYADLGTWAEITTISASVAVLVTTGFVWRQVALQKRGTDNDEKRFLRESIAIVHQTLQEPEFRAARRAFSSAARGKPYTKLADGEKELARSILSIYGMLSRMAARGAIEEDIFSGYWRSTLLKDWALLAPFVAGERARSRNDRLFTETERLVDKWKKD